MTLMGLRVAYGNSSISHGPNVSLVLSLGDHAWNLEHGLFLVSQDLGGRCSCILSSDEQSCTIFWLGHS